MSFSGQNEHGYAVFVEFHVVIRRGCRGRFGCCRCCFCGVGGCNEIAVQAHLHGLHVLEAHFRDQLGIGKKCVRGRRDLLAVGEYFYVEFVFVVDDGFDERKYVRVRVHAH